MLHLHARKASTRKANGYDSVGRHTSHEQVSEKSESRRFWGPVGRGQSPSENVLINREKVAASKRRHWVDAELNHYNKLHSPQVKRR